MNLHLSEVISDILEPIVGTIEGGVEVISGEDMLAKVDRLNETNQGWSKYSWWEGQTVDEYVSCGTCGGSSRDDEDGHTSTEDGQVGMD